MAVCGDPVLPVVVTDFCNPLVRKGQIQKLFITRATSADVLTDVSSLVEWNSRLDNADPIPGSGSAPIREIPVIGSMAEPEITESDISLDRIFRSTPKYTVSFKIDDLSIENIDLIRDYQEAGAATVKFWFLAGDLLFGGDSGIDATIKANLVIPESRTEFMTGTGTLIWTGSTPEAVASPFA